MFQFMCMRRIVCAVHKDENVTLFDQFLFLLNVVFSEINTFFQQFC